MTMRCPVGLIPLAAAALALTPAVPAPASSCSTVVVRSGGSLLAAHNLDESTPVPGLVVVNPRGMAKENRTYDDVFSASRAKRAARIAWVSKYASVTTNVFGREMPDGGLNEAGLYVAEMTLLSTVWPPDGATPRIHHNQWIQYLLDNFATVDEALASLAAALPEGNCKWHFLLADRGGDVAVVEFLDGKPAVYRGADLPYAILGNDAYGAELKDIVNYSPFGGEKDPRPRYPREDPRFRWAAVMLREDGGAVAPHERAFAILERMDLGPTRWSTVFDLRSGRLWFRTDAAPTLKWLDFPSERIACPEAPRAVDIHTKAEGDVSPLLAPLTDEENRRAVEAAWKALDIGTLGNLFFKPRMVRGMSWAAASFHCPSQ